MTNNCGIYLIKFQLNDEVLGVYVGQSNRLTIRFSQHKSQLRRNKHHSLPLQNYYNKYGEDALSFEILELCDEAHLTTREQYWFDYYILLHKMLNTGNMVDCPRRGQTFTHSDETRGKISQAIRGQLRSDETRKRISESKKGRTFTHSDETRKKITETRGTIFPTPELIEQIRHGKTQGLSYRELHDKYHIGIKTLRKILHHKHPYNK